MTIMNQEMSLKKLKETTEEFVKIGIVNDGL
jgi:hypothetical protein